MMKPRGRGSYVMEVRFNGGGPTEITVDSGAEENVCPWEWGSEFATKPPGAGMERNFKGASGESIKHYGERNARVIAPF